MRKKQEIQRLKYEVGLSNRTLARAHCISNCTVGEYVVRARRAGLVWSLEGEQTEEELYQQLFPEVKKPQMVERPMPDWERVHLGWHVRESHCNCCGRNNGRNF